MAEQTRREVGLILHDPTSSYNVYHAIRATMPEYSNPKERDEIEQQAIERCCDIRLHQSFRLPQDSNGRAKPFRVAYSDMGASPSSAEADEDVPVLLWTSGMFGGRYAALELDELAKSHGVRVVSVDRPGIGGTDSVPVEERIAIWLQIVPALLAHLGIKYVSLGCHSAGTIYASSVVLHLRHLLHPERPYMCMFGPWVEPQNSGKWYMKIVSTLPDPFVGNWHVMAKTFYNFDKNVSPYLKPITRVFKKPPPTKSQAERVEERFLSTSKHPATKESNSTGTTYELRVKHGPLCPKALIVPASRLVGSFIFSENFRGASDEALVCMGKGNITSWTGIGNALQEIASKELAQRQSGSSGSNEDPPKLKIDVFYGMKDEMIGKGGQVYLDDCLERASQQGAFESSSYVINNTDHNSVLQPETGSFDIIFATLSGKPGTFYADDARKPGELELKTAELEE